MKTIVIKENAQILRPENPAISFSLYIFHSHHEKL